MFSLRIFFGDKPWIFFFLYGLKSRNRDLFIKKDTELVVNAYPRCGNTYFYYAIVDENPNLKIAHHLHVPALTIDAVKKGKPLAIIIREPSEAVASLLIREPHITINQALALYKQFHKIVLKHQSSILILDFKEVITDFWKVINKLNEKFDLNLNNFDSSDNMNKERIFDNIESIDAKTNTHKKMNEYTVSRPSENTLKMELKNKFKKQAQKHPLFGECSNLYTKLFEISKEELN